MNAAFPPARRFSPPPARPLAPRLDGFSSHGEPRKTAHPGLAHKDGAERRRWRRRDRRISAWLTSTGGPPPSHAYPLKARRLEALGQNRILKRFCFRARPVLVFDFPGHVTATDS